MFFLDLSALTSGVNRDSFFPGGAVLVILVILRIVAEMLFVFRPLINESREFPKRTRFTMLLDVLLVPLLLVFVAFAVERYMTES
ncbi:MAG: hypothetical protein AAF708_10905 [Deinococcota bacterium]